MSLSTCSSSSSLQAWHAIRCKPVSELLRVTLYTISTVSFELFACHHQLLAFNQTLQSVCPWRLRTDAALYPQISCETSSGPPHNIHKCVQASNILVCMAIILWYTKYAVITVSWKTGICSLWSRLDQPGISLLFSWQKSRNWSLRTVMYMSMTMSMVRLQKHCRKAPGLCINRIYKMELPVSVWSKTTKLSLASRSSQARATLQG